MDIYSVQVFHIIQALAPTQDLELSYLPVERHVIKLPSAERHWRSSSCLSRRSYSGKRTKAISMNATRRRGRTVRCHITCTPFLGADKRNTQRDGVVLVMEEAET